MINFSSPSIRIGLSLSSLTVGLLIIADLAFDIVPDQKQLIAESRKEWCESLAIQFEKIIESDGIESVEKIINTIAQQNTEVISLGLRSSNNKLIANTENHHLVWNKLETTQSTFNQVKIPILNNNQLWGNIEVKFQPIGSNWISEFLFSPLSKLIIIMLTFGLVIYSFFIRRTLNFLDPGSVVPDRVKAALDLLAEGVVLLDDSLTIILANEKFTQLSGHNLDQLVGKHLSELNWGKDKSNNLLPWEHVHSQGGMVQGAKLQLRTSEGKIHIVSCNVISILDGEAKKCGTMISFDDVSDIERSNIRLKKTISQLEAAEKKIRNQNRELQKIASTDSLTGVLNRGAFYEKLNTEFALAKQEKLKLSCIMVDIDHFKNVNDTYGHAVGDEVIKGIAKILDDNCNVNGAVGRYGGEEFCLVLPGLDMNAAMKIAEAIRVNFSNWSKQQHHLTDGNVITSSSGVSSIDWHAKDGTAMVNQADEALYYSKNNGRNKVTSYYTVTEMREAS